MYVAPSIQKPGQEEVQEIARELNLKIPAEQIADYHDVICGIFDDSYPALEKYVEPVLPVKYPRTPGYRPGQEENRYNAWYYKSTIEGADSGPLKGYKVVIKDSIPVAGVPMMVGSRVFEGYVPDYDPTVVTRLLDAGATIVGKATCEDFCYCGGSFTSHPGPVLNPHDITRSAGGSSSGCAVLVQTGEVDMGLGADQGGSIRMPACWTGIVGLKPTYGLVPYTGIPSLSTAIDVCGPMTRTVKDCALMLEAIAGDDDGLDMRQRNIPPRDQIPQYSQLLCADVTGMKIGTVTEGFPNNNVSLMVMEAAHKLREKGVTLEEVSIPMHSDGIALWHATCFGGGYQSLIHSQGFPPGPPSYYPTSAIDNNFAGAKSRSRDIPENVKLMEIMGKYVADNYGMHFYAKSQNLCRLLRKKYDEALDKYDVLLMPTITYLAPKQPSPDVTFKERVKESLRMVANTGPFCATGHPALTINACYSDEGLPVGMMMIGKHLQEQNIFNLAYAFEQLRDAKK